MSSAKFDIEKFTGKNDFSIWRIKMRALLVHQGLDVALDGKNLPTHVSESEKKGLLDKAHSALILSLGDKVLREISKEKSIVAVWFKLESLYMTKSLANRLLLNQMLYTFKMPLGKSLEDHMDDFNKIILDLENIEIKVDDEDQALLLLRSLPSEYDSLSDMLIYGRDSLSLDEVKAALFSKELKKKSEGGGYQDTEGLYTRGRTEKKDPKNKKGSRSKSHDERKRRCFVCGSEEHLKKDFPYTRKKK